MSMARSISLRTGLRGIGAACALAAALAATAAPVHAQEASAWWGLTQRVQPTNIQPGSAQNELQEIKVQATGGDVVLTEEESVGKVYACLEGGGAFAECLALIKQACFPYNAEPAEAQSGLEGLYGVGNVEVTGGPGDAEGTKPYEVTFVGELADQPVREASTSFPSFSGCPYLEGNASVREEVEGHPDGVVVVTAENLGNAPADGGREPIVIADTLPAGLKAVSATGLAGSLYVSESDRRATCSQQSGSETRVVCTSGHPLGAYQTFEMRIGVVVRDGAAPEETNSAQVSGGQAAAPKRIARPIHIGGEAAFGVEEALFTPEAFGGTPETQAGSHPFQLTSVVSFNENGEAEPIALPKDIAVLSPAGLVGNPTPFAQCTDEQFSKLVNGEETECPTSSVIGVADVTYHLPGEKQISQVDTPIFNMVPDKGEPARFAFYAVIIPVMLDTSVRTGGDYGVTVTSSNTTEISGLLSSSITLWGVPGDQRHDGQRGYQCLLEHSGCKPQEEINPPPFLTLPTSCTGPLQSSVRVNSWSDRGDVLTYGMTEPVPGMVGCNHLPFDPEIETAPDVENAASPSGLTVGIHVPQKASLNPEGLAEATVKDTTVALPAGMTLNPGGADGLEGCSQAEVGYLGKDATDPSLNLFTSGLPSPFCPDGAKVGTVDIETPLLPNPLQGAVYLASPAPNGEAGENPFNGLVSIYIVAEDPVSGVLVKLPGRVQACERAGEVLASVTCAAPGQLISTFEDTPQLPFEDLTLHFFGGGNAPLATPPLCGSYTTSATIAPWSGNAPATPASTFQIQHGPNGSPCPSNPRPFTPEFNAGMVNNQAGGFSELRTTMGHPDEDQALGALTMTLPPGLSGMLSHVKLCKEPQANEGTCGPESLIGHTTVTAGLGSTPAVVARPGEVYITGPYNGHGACTVGEAGCAPFGLSIANPAEAGPFDLEKGTKCDCVVVRAKVEVDPLTAALTVTSGALPTMIDGIPLDLQHVSVQIDRPEFTINPTSCEKMRITGALSGAEGASAPLSEPFQAASCGALAFEPSFTASTAAKTSRKDGASLHVKLSFPKNSLGNDANIREVKVELPKALPSRLSTLQKACTAAQFEADPAGCPAASIVGHAKAITPILPVPLEGPAYFVSNGGQRFPELIVVLQGYGVTIDLHGETFISKKGITSSTFKTAPDQPLSSFELTLPEGEDSALAANRDLCKARLAMPTLFVAQNGAVVKRKTKIGVQGCKPAIRVLKKKVTGDHVKLKLSVPVAGKLTVDGGDVSRVHEKLKKAGKTTVKLKLAKKARRVLASHPKHGLKAKISLRLTPKHGSKITRTVTVVVR